MTGDSTELSQSQIVGARSAAARAAGVRVPLRLVAAHEAPAAPRPIVTHPLLEPSDPRWVLAVRTAAALDGAILRPEKRRRLLHVGRMLGLSPFDANLVMAIMQDQARRGCVPDHCPAAGEKQLAMVTLPDAYRPGATHSKRRRAQHALAIAATITSFLAAELFWVWWLLF